MGEESVYFDILPQFTDFFQRQASLVHPASIVIGWTLNYGNYANETALFLSTKLRDKHIGKPLIR
jgi:hypothetical protein